MMLDLVAFLLEANRMDEAETSAEAAIDNDPTNPVLYSAGQPIRWKANPKEGKVAEADMIKWYDMAEQAYKKSIEVAPILSSYPPSQRLYSNRAAYEYEKYNKIEDDTKYNACKTKADEITSRRSRTLRKPTS